MCEKDGANLVHIKDEESQKAFNAWYGPKSSDWYNNNPDKEDKGSWIGLTDMNSDPRKPQMEWLFEWGSSPSYQNWIFGQPEQTQAVWPGLSCGFIKETSGQNWDAEVSFAFSPLSDQELCFSIVPTLNVSFVRKCKMLSVQMVGFLYQLKVVLKMEMENVLIFGCQVQLTNHGMKPSSTVILLEPECC